MACYSPITAVDRNPPSTISAVHQDIIETHILTRVDGPTLASLSCVSSELQALASEEHLWAKICTSTWPSTNATRVNRIISSFPGGPGSFFSDAYPVIIGTENDTRAASLYESPLSGLISAVDLFHCGNLIFSKVVETETETETATGWFQCSPFRIDLVGPKDKVATSITVPETEDTCRCLEEDLTLSWIVIDPIRRRAANVSSHRPVTVYRHWLSGEIHARFASVVEAKRFGIVVTCGVDRGSELRVSEVSLQVEDADGTSLNGSGSMVILRRAMEGKRGKGGMREEETKREYEKFLEKKRRRKERMRRTEGILDMLCVAFGGFLFFLIIFLADQRFHLFGFFFWQKNTDR